ncbi:MAG: ribose 5-phosphate isomerase B [Desulfovibrio sp.]|nr:ribose 5-phosphate isomerase B [Desulfovibrio sp.]
MSIVHIACDHAGFALKERIKQELASLGHEVVDHGTNSDIACDYPEYAKLLTQACQQNREAGILICGTGIGMSMAANRVPGIRAALCTTETHAKLARKHNNANVLCLGARLTGETLALAITCAFLSTPFEGGRHSRRCAQLETMLG